MSNKQKVQHLYLAKNNLLFRFPEKLNFFYRYKKEEITLLPPMYLRCLQPGETIPQSCLLKILRRKTPGKYLEN